MFNTNSFLAMFKLLNLESIFSAVTAHKSDKYTKNMNTLSHLMAGMYIQIANPHGLREMELHLGKTHPYLARLGVNKITRSAFSDANKSRDSGVFLEIVNRILPQSLAGLGELKECLSIIDSSTITVLGRGSQWTEETKTRMGRGLKLHVEYLFHEDVVNSIHISATNINDLTAAIRELDIREGWVYVFDKAYADYNWWHRIHQLGAYFVTRLKKKAKVEVLASRKVDKKTNPYILSDQYVKLSNKTPRAGKRNDLAETELRLIVAINPEDNKEYTFLTNNLVDSPSVIAKQYKRRWAIELLFKWLKQNLKIRRFHSENENGIKIQIYTAIITYILIGILKRTARNILKELLI